MKRKILSIAISLSLSFGSLGVSASEICVVDTRYTKTEKLVNDFEPNTKISEFETMTKVDVEKDIPNFSQYLAEIGFTPLDFFNVEIGGFQLADGIETGNTQEIVNSSVMIGTSFAAPVITAGISSLIDSLALEVSSETGPIGMIVTWSILEGLNIYNGVESEKDITTAKDDLDDMKKIYDGKANKILEHLSNARKVIVNGNDDALLKIDENNVGQIVVQSLKDRMKQQMFALAKHAGKVYADKTFTKSLVQSHTQISDSDDLDTKLAKLSGTMKNLYTVAPTKLEYIYNGTDYFMMNLSLYKDRPALDWSKHLTKAEISAQVTNDNNKWYQLVNSDSMVEMLKLMGWANKSYVPFMQFMMETMYDKPDVVFELFSKTFEAQLHDPNLQERILNSTNDVLLKKYSWVKFGSELIQNLDFTDEKAEDAGIWISRIIVPMFDGFYDASAMKGILKELQVEPQIAALVDKLISSEISIRDKDSYLNIINMEENDHDFPSSLLNALDSAYNNTLNDVNALVIDKSEIKPFNLSTDKINSLMTKLNETIHNGDLTKNVNDALDDYVRSTLLFHPDGNAPIVTLYSDVAQRIASYQSLYFNMIGNSIEYARTEIKNDSSRYNVNKQLNILGNTIESLKYSFDESHMKINFPQEAQDRSWIDFGTVPFIAADTKYILDVISSEVFADKVFN